MDKIKINDLRVRTIIGTEDYEREEQQELILNLTLFVDLRQACRSDDLRHTVDYSDLKSEILKMADGSGFQLLEKLAQEVAKLGLRYSGVEEVKVSVRKPAALRFAGSAEVEIVRNNCSD